MNLLDGKTEYALRLFRFFMLEYEKLGSVTARPTKSMIAIDSSKPMAYITQIGKNFIHVVFPFGQAFEDNFCFTKIAQVPGTNQFNHHLRIYAPEDVNDEVKNFMKLTLDKTLKS